METTKLEWTMEKQSRLANTLTLALAVWLLAAPVVFGYTWHVGAFGNSWFVGGIVGLLSVVRRVGRMPDTIWASWTEVLFGVWLLFSPFILNYTQVPIAQANDVIVGILLCISAAWSGSASGVITHKWV